MIRIGQGIDVHAFINTGETEQFVMLGGVKIPHTHSLLAHSDGDVVLHALCDALLGALALGDIGQFFPDTDEQFSGIDSKILLTQVYALIQSHGYQLVNTDITVMAERPKLLPYQHKIKQSISNVLGCQNDQISIKATTTEKLGFTGRQEGITASCVVLIAKKPSNNV
ncbi:2-C-methyl-D-erythritol 2,4-cyclodiphosphate synthase [Moraxella macacae 0408225]|uniref:2-C-methyl-D-erythritol 2,4-cyclodiphosphate synthase n=1 Tax=Moraxella macacae 0408225 TaxID=1230338 RepID=L2FAD4_9GAMM|nr:2-C-methyl-D-erythritol 2,4-cyclodiphosphate synthase [Moraxella macacae]ELA09711.1 2-C-methyl-D-erythritol 2,4-cyclodiphosphate synthase [Moraxella macacae 0408225]